MPVTRDVFSRSTYITDWVPFTMVITGSVSNPAAGAGATSAAAWRRVGDSMEINFNFSQTAAGSAGSGLYLFSIPTGFTIDSTKTLTTNNNASAVGASSA